MSEENTKPTKKLKEIRERLRRCAATDKEATNRKPKENEKKESRRGVESRQIALAQRDPWTELA